MGPRREMPLCVVSRTEREWHTIRLMKNNNSPGQIRLCEDPSVTVCVLEAGPSDVGDDDILKLERWMGLLESGYDWDYPVEPQERGNSFMRHARAKVLGGCSSHNSCIAFHPPAECLDEWVDMGATG